MLASCSDEEAGAPTEPAAPTPQYTISGTVTDSLGGFIGRGGLPGLEVRVNGRALTTDRTSRWSRTVDSGMVVIEVNDNRFELYRQVLLLQQNMDIAVQLRRLAPVIVGFSVAGDSVTARVVDLQGRKTVERWNESHVDVIGAVTTTTVIGRQLHWHPVDNWTYHMVLPSLPDDATMLDWTVEDDRGFSYQESCNLSTGCRRLPSND